MATQVKDGIIVDYGLWLPDEKAAVQKAIEVAKRNNRHYARVEVAAAPSFEGGLRGESGTGLRIRGRDRVILWGTSAHTR